MRLDEVQIKTIRILEVPVYKAEIRRRGGMMKYLLHSKYPCCGGKTMLRVFTALPRERYKRRCPRCKFLWLVSRARIASGNLLMEKLDWSA